MPKIQRRDDDRSGELEAASEALRELWQIDRQAARAASWEIHMLVVRRRRRRTNLQTR